MTIVPTPEATAPPHSLVRSAITNRDGDDGWQRGLEYAPETCGGYRAISGCTAETIDHGADNPPVAAVDYVPWEVHVADPCTTTFGYVEEEVTARLRRWMDATESYAIARELWTGELTKADVAAAASGDPNAYLTNAPTVLGGGAVSPKRALGLLQGAVGDALHGQQSFLHVPRIAEPYLPDLVKVGNLLYTRLDNVVVADAGYPNVAPDGQAAPADGTAWVYATGPVVVRRSGLQIDSFRDAEVIDTRTNTRRRSASKTVAATFDPCALFAVQITLT